MKITPEMFGLTKEEVAKMEKQDERLAKLREKLAEVILTPDPGTPEAIYQGCECPPLKYQPAPIEPFTSRDWMCVNPSCRIHGWKKP